MKYTTFDEAVHREIVAILEVGVDYPDEVTDVWDIDVIAQKVIETDGKYFWVTNDEEFYWEVVENAEI